MTQISEFSYYIPIAQLEMIYEAVEDMKRDYSKVYASFIPEGIDFDLNNMLFCNEFGLRSLGLFIDII